MDFLKTIWSLLFRLFPCPTKAGLRRIGHPGRNSPVLVTCNFHLTVKRLVRILHGKDVWLLVARSKGINVWCAAGADEFNTHSVVSSIKTSGIDKKVDHRAVILPPLGAPGVHAGGVREQTGWHVRWGPVRAVDIPAYLDRGCRRERTEKRVTYNAFERLDTAAGGLFPFYLLGALGFGLFGPSLFFPYLIIGAICFFIFMLTCPWLPGNKGLTKVLFLEVILGGVFISGAILNFDRGMDIRPHVIIAMVMTALFGTELGGLAPHMKSELDPFLARMGIGAIGNVALAGTVRNELLNGDRELVYDSETCIGCRTCAEICPVGVWDFDGVTKKVILSHKDRCTACRACLVQCSTGSIRAPVVGKDPIP